MTLEERLTQAEEDVRILRRERASAVDFVRELDQNVERLRRQVRR